MSILQKFGLETIENHWRRPEDPVPAHVIVEAEESQLSPRYNGFTHEYAFTVRALAQTTFYANQAQYEGRREMAEKELLHLIYGPVLARLHRMRSRIADRDFRSAMAEVDSLEKELLE